MTIRHLLLTGLLFFVSSLPVTTQETKPTPTEVTGAAVDTSKYKGWKKIEESSFSFYAPQDMKGGVKRGIDTSIYRYENGQLIVSFDIGMLANPAPHFETKEIMVDGHNGQIAHRTDQSLLYIQLGKNTNFNMYVTSQSPDRRDIAEKMFMSLRFKGK